MFADLQARWDALSEPARAQFATRARLMLRDIGQVMKGAESYEANLVAKAEQAGKAEAARKRKSRKKAEREVQAMLDKHNEHVESDPPPADP